MQESEIFASPHETAKKAYSDLRFSQLEEVDLHLRARGM
mgnify:FL=1